MEIAQLILNVYWLKRITHIFFESPQLEQYKSICNFWDHFFSSIVGVPIHNKDIFPSLLLSFIYFLFRKYANSAPYYLPLNFFILGSRPAILNRENDCLTCSEISILILFHKYLSIGPYIWCNSAYFSLVFQFIVKSKTASRMYSRLSMVKPLYCEKKWFQAVDKGK